MATRNRSNVLLVNLGTTQRPDEESVRAFLTEFLSDPEVVDYPQWLWQPILRKLVLRKRPAAVAELYRTIWTDGGSPLAVETERIASALREAAAGDFDVHFAYRYGEPSIESALVAGRDSYEDQIVVPLFPQETGSTTGTVERLVEDISKRTGVANARVWMIPPDDEGYVAALASCWGAALESGGIAPEHLVVSFHGIPARYDRRERGKYRRHCEQTTEAMLRAFPWPRERTTLAYQSRFGPERWIGPSTAKTLEELPAAGVRRVAVITPGFLTEGLETIEEIGMRGEDSFLGAGGEAYLRIPCVGAHPRLVESLAKSIRAL